MQYKLTLDMMPEDVKQGLIQVVQALMEDEEGRDWDKLAVVFTIGGKVGMVGHRSIGVGIAVDVHDPS